MELILPFEDVHAFGSVGVLVKELARRGNALFDDGRDDAPRAVLLRPSTMRVEYKVPDKQSGVKRRVQLTPASSVGELEHAESLLITPHR